MQLIVRFLVGGAVVCLFASLADMLKPKSFAGLFGAAPSVALATLGLTILTDGKPYAAMETRSMIAGAAGFLAYASACCWLMMKRHTPTLATTVAAMTIWFAVSFGIWVAFLR